VTEPELHLAPSLRPVLDELKALEPLFHAVAQDATPEAFEALVAPEFWEVGASGRRYSRAYALSVLKERGRMPDEALWRTEGFHVAALGADHYLLTYTLHQPGRTTRRATVWRRAQDRWQALYHQGTVVAPT
jgi:hypothetical protein